MKEKIGLYLKNNMDEFVLNDFYLDGMENLIKKK